MVVDVFTWNGEKEIFDLHYNIAKECVDEFRVLSFDKTFSGKIKDKIFPSLDWELYPKAKFYLHTEHTYGKYLEMAYLSPNTHGAGHWKLEFAQKESIKDILSDLKDDDTVVIGDVDEVIDLPRSVLEHWNRAEKLKLKVYTYFLNNRSSEEFWGPLIARWGGIKDMCLNHERQNAAKGLNEAGWHFTSMGGSVSLRNKLTDSYTHESYATPQVLENIAYNIENRKDFLGRNFSYKVDESEWPQYLKEHRAEYAHLLAS